MSAPEELPRCPWVGEHPLEVAYHDTEWGVPVRGDDAALLERLTLEGAQAGLSWRTVLLRREGYWRVFEGFDLQRLAAWGPEEVDRALADPGIIRHRGKVESVVGNARAVLALREEGESFAELVWSFVGGEPRVSTWERLEEIPSQTPESKAMSKALKARGFRFVGPTLCYAFMQATGMVMDHTVGCFRYPALSSVKGS